MPQGRPRKFDDEFHRKLRAKVAAHRKRKAAEIAIRSQQRALIAGRQPQESQARWRLFERIEPLGDVGDVLLIRDAEPLPSGYAAGGWLPSSLLPFHLARSLATSRRRHLREWLASRQP